MAINTLFENIADAIRERAGTSGTITPAQMPQAIADIPGGGSDPGHLMHFDFTQSNVDEILGITASLTGCTITQDGLLFNAGSQNCKIPYSFGVNMCLEVEFGNIDFKGSSNNHTSIIMFGSENSDSGLLRRNNGKLAYFLGSWYEIQNMSSINELYGKKLKLHVLPSGIKTYIDNVLVYTTSVFPTTSLAWTNNNINIGNTRSASSGGQFYDVIVKTADLYYLAE